MAEMLNLLKPAPFKVKSKGDPEQLHIKVEKYVDNFKEFHTATEVDGEHTADRAVVDDHHCEGCKKAKAYRKLIGG